MDRNWSRKKSHARSINHVDMASSIPWIEMTRNHYQLHVQAVTASIDSLFSASTDLVYHTERVALVQTTERELVNGSGWREEEGRRSANLRVKGNYYRWHGMRLKRERERGSYLSFQEPLCVCLCAFHLGINWPRSRVIGSRLDGRGARGISHLTSPPFRLSFSSTFCFLFPQTTTFWSSVKMAVVSCEAPNC